ncbi:thioredoxin fold domain-containing protein [Bacillaceae bacterium Marseille-Q3522]|nr:thioredoxin fold domain-containing protein [Bacillaceae bacterium Marseille-Q3522]
MKKTVITIVIVVVAAILVIALINRNNITSMEDMEYISYQDSFQQDENQYIVYFWQSTCKYCKEIENDVLEFARNGEMPIYVVDMQDENNVSAWYDWEGHHQQYDKIIGKIVDGKEELNEDFDPAAYENEPNVNWTFEINDKDEIVARHNTAFGNENPETADEIEVTGTPTMILVNDGKVSEYGVGVDETREIMGND